MKKTTKLRTKIIRYLVIVSLLVMTLIVVLAMGVRGMTIHRDARSRAQTFFGQMERAFNEFDASQFSVSSRTEAVDHLFSVLGGDDGVTCFYVDPESMVIECSTNTADKGVPAGDVGLPSVSFSGELYATHATVHGAYSYCVFTHFGDRLVIYTATRASLYKEPLKEIAVLSSTLLLVALILVLAVTRYLRHYVLDSLDSVNRSLAKITAGDLNETVHVKNSTEFAELSSRINEMIGTLLSTTDILSAIFNKTGLNIGIFIYNEAMRTVRCTDCIPRLLNLDEEEMQELCADHTRFEAYIDRLRERPLSGERNVFQLYGNNVRYLRIEEDTNNNETFGVVIDMTEEIEKRQRLESERDVDLLTGLFNRRGFKEALNAMFRHPEELGYGALFMIDADDLKFINDTYGHKSGDAYLKALAELLRNFGSRKNIAARLGGDEYVVFLYGYRRDSDLQADITALQLLQDMGYTRLANDVSVLVRFSMGYALTYGKTDYSPLMKEADDLMYANKRFRKQNRPSKSTR